MALQQTGKGTPGSAYKSVFFVRLYGIVGAGRIKPAGGLFQRRKKPPVESEYGKDYLQHTKRSPLCECLLQLESNLSQGKSVRSLAGNDVTVHIHEKRLVETEAFSNKPLYPVTLHGISHFATRRNPYMCASTFSR